MCATCLQGLRLSSNKAEGKSIANKWWENSLQAVFLYENTLFK